jgi:hypothetical protein
MCSVNA